VEENVGWMALSQDGRNLVTTGGEDSARLVPVDGSTPQALGGFDQRVLRAAVGRHGRLVAVPGLAGGRLVVRVWDLEAGTATMVDFGDRLEGRFGIMIDLEVTPDGRLLSANQGRLLMVDPATGQRTTVAEGVGHFTAGREGTLVLSRPTHDLHGVVTVHDLVSGAATVLSSHGHQVKGLALDESGAIAVTGSADGVVRVGPVSGEEPHWLVGHEGSVEAVAVSPDGRWIASGGDDGTIRLWPMPDLTKPPLHALPRAELVARLRSLTNLRVGRDPDDPESYLVTADPFPGWQTTPVW
jgi:WD40 repeat protein